MELLSTQLTNLFEKFQTISDEYSDYKELVFNDYNLELAEDSIKVLKLLNNGRKVWSMTKFKNFIKGLNIDSNEENINKLINYVDNKEKAEFITNSFEKILSSNSKLACCTLGIMLNDLCTNEKNITQGNLVILQALSMMNDFDIINFTHLMIIRPWGKSVKYNQVSSQDINKCAKKYNNDVSDINLTIQLLEKYGLIENEGEIDLSMDSDDIDFSSAEYKEKHYFNLLSKKLFEYTKKIITQ